MTCNYSHVLTECINLAIIGGGPGGTYAAYSLRDRGLSIKLFEQHGRLGGRTYSFPIPGMIMKAELGAMRLIPGLTGTTRTIELCEELGLAMRDFTSDDSDELIYYLRDTLLSQEDFLHPDRVPYNMEPDEEGRYASGVYRYILICVY